jgi:hypothetical protein
MKRLIAMCGAVLLPIAVSYSSQCVRSEDELDKESLITQAREFLSRVEIHTGDLERPEAVAELCSRPVLVFSDQPRAHPFGSVWIWGREGRPAAIVEVYISGGSNYANVLHALSEDTLSGRSQAGWKWQPQSSGLTLVSLAEDGLPAARSEARLIQCRTLAKSFTVVQREYYDPDETPTILRLLPQPIHRYADSQGGIVDGALFAFVHGETNPEAILVVEARKSGGQAQWHFGFVRLGHAEMTAKRNDRQVWHAERIEGLPPEASPYFYISPALIRTSE